MTVNRESGFSLLELLLAAFLTVGLMGVIFTLANKNQGVFITESGVADMNQNARTAMDMLTRDIQSAGMGLPAGKIEDNLAAIYYVNGEGDDPDSVMMLNGDPFAPTALVTSQSGLNFVVTRPVEVPLPTPSSGTSQVYTYEGEDNVQNVIYDDFTADARQYLVYDPVRAMRFTLAANGVGNAAGPGVAANSSITLTRNDAGWVNPAEVFGSEIDLGEPTNYNDQSAKIAVLHSTIAYRLNMATHELERTENLADWFPIARGILGFQIRYRVVHILDDGTSEEVVTDSPGDGVTTLPSGALTDRREIASLIITLAVETPDVETANKSYRRVVHRFEVTPRNLSMGRQ
jgi:hypothetical protein